MGSRRNGYSDYDDSDSSDEYSRPPRRNNARGRGKTTNVPDRYRTVEGIASYYENKFPTYDVSGRHNPVESTTVRNTGGRQAKLPLVVRSTITADTLRPANSRERFNSRIHRHFDDMQPVYDDEDEEFDERGHIVSSKLGGPNDTYNIFPQTRSLNRHAEGESDWRYLEQDMEQFIENNPGASIDHTAVLLYEDEDRPNRPSEVGVSVKLFNKRGQQVDFDGRRVSKRSNELENNFFEN